MDDEVDSWDSRNSVFNGIRMTDQSDYRTYLESKFDAIHEKLDTIVEQVKKTNGTTIELGKEDKRIEKKIDDSLIWAHHVVDSRVTECPLLPRIVEVEGDLKDNTNKLNTEVARLESDLFEYRFFKKYPKLTLILVAVFVIGSIISLIGTIETIGNKKRGKEIIEMQKEQYTPFKDTAEIRNE